MSASEDFIPLDKWSLLERDRIQRAVDMALQMLADGYIKQATVILEALSNRLKVDDSVLEYFDRRDGGQVHELRQ